LKIPLLGWPGLPDGGIGTVYPGADAIVNQTFAKELTGNGGETPSAACVSEQ